MLRDEPSLWPTGAEPAHGFRAEDARAKILAAYDLDELEDDPQLAAVTAFAAKLCEAPVALVSLVEEERQRFLAREGFEPRETPRSTSLCATAMLGEDLLVVPDATDDPRFADFQLVKEEDGIRFYAGAPLVSAEGAPLGSLCVIDFEPRPAGLNDLQRQGLLVLAQSVMRRLASRRQFVDAALLQSKDEDRFYSMVDAMPVLGFSADREGKFDYYSQGWREFTGQENDLAGDLVHPDDREGIGASWREALSKGTDLEAELRLKRHDGVYRWMLVRAKPFRGSDGSLERWFGTLSDIEDERQNLARTDLLARELSHRIKNIFAVITGLISIRSRRAPEAREFADELNASIRALGRAHDFVRPVQGRKGDSLKGLLGELLAPYGVGDRIVIDGNDAEIGERAATPLALVFHELATNSAKYGALSDDHGKIFLRLAHSEEDAVEITWRETEISADAQSDKEGFGSRLVKLAVEGQLGGTIERERLGDEMLIHLSLPAPSISA